MTGVTADQIANLAQPFAPEAVHWRAQGMTQDKSKAMALAYIDARDVMDRLDGMCGPDNWQDSYVETPKGRIICTLSIRVDGEWVSKSDGAGETDVESDKGALSDALKRAAVKWGIGRYLYSLKSPWVPCEVGQNGKFKKFTEDPWKFVRGPAPAQPVGGAERHDTLVDHMLIEIDKADTLPALETIWRRNREFVASSPRKAELTAAKDKRKAAIETMDQARAA